jgi:hypothetical protein
MGITPQSEGITIDFDCQFKVHLKDSRISTILAGFAALLPQLLMDCFQKVLVGFGEYAMALKKKPFTCKCGNDADFIWKTRHGKELKVFVQYKQGGGVRVAGLDLGNYNGSWDKLFKNSIEMFKGFSQFLLLTDGDTAILDSLKDKVKIIFQRCLWHIPHQAKYVLWQDAVKRKSAEWLYVIAELMEICAIRPSHTLKMPGLTCLQRSKKD